MKHLLKMLDLSTEEIIEILDLADQLKYELKHGIPHPHLKGKSLGMIFQKPLHALGRKLRTTDGEHFKAVQGPLTVLAGAELIDSRKTGRVVTHRLRREPLRRYDDWLAARSGFWTEQLDALAGAFGDPAPERKQPK